MSATTKQLDYLYIYGIRPRQTAQGLRYFFPVINAPKTEGLEFGQPYAYSASLKDFIKVSDPETAILILTLLNEGIILGHWKQSVKEPIKAE